MDEETLKTIIDGWGEMSKVKLQQCLEVNQLEAVLTEHILKIDNAFFTILIPLFILAALELYLLFLLSNLKNLMAPDKELVSFFFIKCITNQTFPKYLDLRVLDHSLRVLCNQESEEVKSFCHLFLEAEVVDLVSHHGV